MDQRPAYDIIFKTLRELAGKSDARWAADHVLAWRETGFRNPTVAHERALKRSIEAWADFGDTFLALHSSKIGDDGVLGPAWESMGRALLELLNGEHGRLDGGTLDRIIRAVAKVHGVDLDAA